MTYFFRPVPPLAEQQKIFDLVAKRNDIELRNTGFCEWLSERGIYHGVGMLVVARAPEYSTQLATMALDLDPQSERLGVAYEVGVLKNIDRGFSYHGVDFAWAFEGESAQPIPERGLDYVQHTVAKAAIIRLCLARNGNPFITKSLLRVDPCGD